MQLLIAWSLLAQCPTGATSCIALGRHGDAIEWCDEGLRVRVRWGVCVWGMGLASASGAEAVPLCERHAIA